MWSNEAFFRYFLSLYKTLKPVIGSLLTPLRSEQLLLRGQLQLNTKGPGPTFKNKSSFGNVSWTIYDCNRNLLLIKVAETKINRYWAAIMAKCTPCRNICSVHKERNLIYFPSPSLAFFVLHRLCVETTHWHLITTASTLIHHYFLRQIVSTK